MTPDNEVSYLRRDLSALSDRVTVLEQRVSPLEGVIGQMNLKLDNLSQTFDLKLSPLTKNVALWNRIGMTILTAIVTGFMLAIIAFIVAGGLKPPLPPA